jgi:outer membrane protein assembly factor BamB
MSAKSLSVLIKPLFRTTLFAIIAVVTTAALCFGQSVTLSPDNGPPTTTISVAGSGFTPNAAIQIFFDTNKEALAVADSNGAFSRIQIKALSSAVSGKHWVSAVQRSGGSGAQSPFWVHTDWAQLGFNSWHSQWNLFENVLSASTVKNLSPQWTSAISGPAALVSKTLYLGSGDNVYALNSANGQVLWQYATAGTVAGPPAVEDNYVYASSGDFNVYALNAADGSLAWKFPTGSFVVAPPVVANGVVYVASDDNNAYALNGTDGTLLWKFSTAGPVQFAPAVANGIVYVASSDGNIYAVNATSGTQLWKYTTTSQNNLSSPSIVNGIVYAASADDNMYAINASSGTLIWKTNLGAPADGSTAAVANGVVYVGSGDGGIFYALDAITGAVRWTYSTKVPVYSASAVADGVVYFGDGNGNFYAFDATKGTSLWQYATSGFFPNAIVTNGRVYLSSGSFYSFGVPGSSDVNLPPPNLKSLH